MGFSRDVMRADTHARRALQRERNLEAMAEEEERQERLAVFQKPGGGRRKMRAGSPEDKMIPDAGGVEIKGDGTGEALPEAETLEGVPFASHQALAKAERLGLVASHFAGREFSGKSGFNAADVTELRTLIANEAAESGDDDDA
jgi:hypothetical protein